MVTRSAAILVALAAFVAAPRAQATVSLGQDLAGEACQTAGQLDTGEAIEIDCGNPASTAGALTSMPLPRALPADVTARRSALAALLTGNSDEISCGGPSWLGQSDQAVVLCTVNSSGWPRVIVGSAIQGQFYRAEGLPVAFPALEAAIAAASGSPKSIDQAQQALALVRSKLPPEQLKARPGDYADYSQFIEAGRLAGAANKFSDADESYRKALEIETRLFGTNAFVVGQTLTELALQVSNEGRFAEAQGLFQRATPIIEASSSQAARARLASYRALDAANQHDYSDALKYAREATAARRAEIASAQGSSDAPVSRGELAHSLRIEASMALRLGDMASARAAAEEALGIVSNEPGLPLWWRPEVVSLIGEINATDGRVVRAEENFRDARDLDQTLFDDTAPTALADLRLGQFYSEQQVYAPAIAAYRSGFAILAKDPIGRAQVMPSQIVPFIAAMSASSTGDAGARDAETYRASQLASAGMLDQTIALVAAREAAGSRSLTEIMRQAESAARTRDKLRIDLAAEFAKADDERNSVREDKLEADVTLASTHADELFGRVSHEFPRYANLTYAAPAELKDVQAALGPHDALLSFVIGMRSSYALLVTAQSFHAQRLDVTELQVSSDIADLRRAFTPRLGKVPDFDLSVSYGLYKSLLAPLEQNLAGVDHLIVAPDSSLDNLPFALLVTQAPSRGTEHSYSNAAWLIRRMAVSQVPSPRAFLALRTEEQHRVPPPRPFLGIGDPNFSGASGPSGAKALTLLADSCRSDGPIAPDLLRALAPLPDTDGEIKFIASRFAGGTVLLGAHASESDLRAQALDQYATLYFATHGLLPGELHCASEPSLALSPPMNTPSSTDADGLLTASEIAQLKLNADLVVLSACNTASSATGPGGAALEGLADAFFAAGARTVLASEWEVPSLSTQKLMTGVFDRATASASFAQALRQSQLALISQSATAHPFYWAAFTLIGDGTASFVHLHTAQMLMGSRS